MYHIWSVERYPQTHCLISPSYKGLKSHWFSLRMIRSTSKIWIIIQCFYIPVYLPGWPSSSCFSFQSKFHLVLKACLFISMLRGGIIIRATRPLIKNLIDSIQLQMSRFHLYIYKLWKFPNGFLRDAGFIVFCEVCVSEIQISYSYGI